MPAGREAPRLDSMCHKRGIFARGELPRGGTADECLRRENTGCAEVFHTREDPAGVDKVGLAVIEEIFWFLRRFTAKRIVPVGARGRSRCLLV